MKGLLLSSSAVAAVTLLSTITEATTYFKETFDDESWKSRWVQSQWKDNMGRWELGSGAWNVNPSIEQGLQTKDDARFYGIASKLEKPFSNKDKDLVVQFSVKNDEKQTSFCGGGYIKLLPKDTDLKNFGGDTPYYIMFGPDICGYDVSRIHVIFNYEDENLLRKNDIKLDYDDKDDLTHLYTLVVHPDNTYEVYFDQKERASGSLFDEWDFPSETIPDPSDIKPANWVDDAMIPDPNDIKPQNWDDEPQMIPDPSATKPDDWDEEDDGEWQAPQITNPAYKGEWTPKKISNPLYKGPWMQKKIPNEKFNKEVYKYDDIGAVGFELWIVNSGSIFDNIYVGDSLDEAKDFAAKTFGKIKTAQKEAKKAHDDANKAKDDVEAERKLNAEPDDDYVEEPEVEEKTEL